MDKRSEPKRMKGKIEAVPSVREFVAEPEVDRLSP